jgi:hypothetical protein
MSGSRLAALAVAAMAASGCAGKVTTYRWGNYDEALYAHYKSPQDRQAYIASLKTIILAAQGEGKTVPPGIYAEYGYALFEEGNSVEAVAYFERERDAWPESRVFMEKLIAAARRRPPPPAPPAAPASELEKARPS